jgi:hypothetical protein
MRVGHVLGTINTAILLTVVYLLMFPWIKLWWLVSRSDPMGARLYRRGRDGSSWSPPDTPGSPNRSELENLF